MKRFRQNITIMFSDCDTAQIVFYPNYFRWFDQATQRMFNEVDLKWSKMWPKYDMAGVPLVDVSAKFTGPAKMDEDIVLETWIDEWKGKIFIVRHDIIKDDKVIVEATEIRAWAIRDKDAANGIRAGVIPDEVKARFE